MKYGRIVDGCLLVIGLGFAFLGQVYLFYRQQYALDAVVFWCLAVLGFVLLARRAGRGERGRSYSRPWIGVVEHPWRVLSALGGACLSLAVGWAGRRRPEDADFTPLLVLWLVGVGLFLAAFAPRFSVREVGQRLVGYPRANWRGLVGLAALVLAALAVRAFDLEHIPVNLGGDEGTWGMEALAMFGQEGLANPFATRWFGFPSLSFLVWGLSMRLFGDTVAGLRALSALIGTASVLTTYLLARDLWDRRVAWLAAAVLAFGHFHIHYSRLALNNIADTLLVTLALYLLLRGLRSGRAMLFALAGAVVGLGWYGYFGARLVGLIGALYVGWRMAVEYGFASRHVRSLLLVPAAALVVALPLLLHHASQPGDLSAGWHRVSILVPGWLAREQVYWGVSAGTVLWRQVWKSLSGFHYTLDTSYHYHASIPLLDLVSGALLVVGLVWTIVRGRRPANGLLLIYFWSTLITGWVLTENPPSSQRLVMVAPALALLVALGLNWLVNMGQRVFGGGHRLWNGLVVVTMIAIALLNLRYYFAVYTPSGVYGNPTAEVATVLGRYLAWQDDGFKVYFHASPVMFWNIGNLRFLARGVEGVDVPPGEDGWPEVDLQRGARFVVLPHRLDELDSLRARFPGGREVYPQPGADGRLLYVLYEVRSDQ